MPAAADVPASPSPTSPDQGGSDSAELGAVRSAADRFPKIELHVHLEGSVRPATLLEIARRNGESLPADSVEGLRELFTFTGFEHFIEVWIVTTFVLQGARGLPPDHRRLRRRGRGTGLRLHRGHLLAGGTGHPRRLVAGDLRGLLRRHPRGARAPRRRDAPDARHHAGLRPGARRGDGAARRRLPRAGRGRYRARRTRGPAGAVRARLRRRARGRSRLGASRRRGGRAGLDPGRSERPEGRPHPPRHQGGRGSGAARGAGARAASCST